MIPLIIIVVFALFFVLIGFTWYRLDMLENVEKILVCAGGIIVSLIITNILLSISSKGINYQSEEVRLQISKMIVLVFTPINGITYMPYLSGIINKIRIGENIEDLDKKILRIAIIVIIVFFIEVLYFKKIQLGIFDIANNLKH